jgi:hypothetical protein
MPLLQYQRQSHSHTYHSAGQTLAAVAVIGKTSLRLYPFHTSSVPDRLLNTDPTAVVWGRAPPPTPPHKQEVGGGGGVRG